LFRGLRLVVTGGVKLGVTTLNQNIELLTGFNMNFETVFLKK